MMWWAVGVFALCLRCVWAWIALIASVRVAVFAVVAHRAAAQAAHTQGTTAAVPPLSALRRPHLEAQREPRVDRVDRHHPQHAHDVALQARARVVLGVHRDLVMYVCMYVCVSYCIFVVDWCVDVCVDVCIDVCVEMLCVEMRAPPFPPPPVLAAPLRSCSRRTSYTEMGIVMMTKMPPMNQAAYVCMLRGRERRGV